MGLDQVAMDRLLALEVAKSRKLEILFGRWWHYYAIPYEFRATLYVENSKCPYCGGALGPLRQDEDLVADETTAHLDHMDPLSRGGEESIRNTVYVCSDCNLSKGRRLFVDWLATLDPEHRVIARNLYEAKHGHPPEDFQPGPPQPRLTLERLELQLDESVLLRLFPSPIVDAPPLRTLLRL